MFSALKPYLFCMKLLGFCSLKLSNPLECHGCSYYIWSSVVISVTFVGVLSHSFPPVTLVFYIVIVFVYLLMTINGMINEKKLIQLLTDVHVFDQRTGFNNSVKIDKNSVKICMFWILYGAVKMMLRVSSGFDARDIVVKTIVFQSDILTMSLLSTIYEQITLRYDFLFTKLLFYINSKSTDINQFLESIRVLYFFLGNIVSKTNQYSGFWIFGSIFNRHLHCFLKLVFIFNLTFMTMSFKTAILLIPDEFLQIIYLSYTADLLQKQSKQISTLLKNFAVCNMTAQTKMQVKMFLQQIEASPVKVSAGSLFEINKPLLLSMLITSATYFVTFYMMKNELEKLTEAIMKFLYGKFTILSN